MSVPRVAPALPEGRTNELLGYMSESDSTLVDQLFARRRDERVRNAQARLEPLKSLKARSPS